MLEQINQNPTAAALLKTGEQVLPKAATYVLAVLCLWLIAGAIWLWIPHPPLPAAAVQTPNNTTNPESERADVNALISRHLFGEATAVSKPKPQQDSSDAPETRLNLKLAGVILSDDPDMSRALIATSNGKQKAYAVEDEIDGSSASIHEIHAEHVVLERAGRYETLRLQKLTGASRPTTTARTNSPSTVGAGVTTELKTIREQLLKDPSKAGDFIRVRPVYSKGQLKGSRLYRGHDRALFRKVGPRPGRLVTALTWQTPHAPQQALQLISGLDT